MDFSLLLAVCVLVKQKDKKADGRAGVQRADSFSESLCVLYSIRLHVESHGMVMFMLHRCNSLGMPSQTGC